VEDTAALEDVDLSTAQAEEVYRYLAIANYEDRFVVPTAHREEALKYAQAEASGCGFTFGNGCSEGNSEVNVFGGKKTNRKDVIASVQIWEE
jgi:nitrate reductase beta subunit